MSRSNRSLVIYRSGVLVAGILILVLVSPGLSTENWFYALALIAAIAVADYYNVKLPRGDELPESLAPTAAALLLFPGASGLYIAFIAYLVSVFIKSSRGERHRGVYVAARRVVTGFIATAFLGFPQFAPFNAPRIDLFSIDALKAMAVILVFSILEVCLEQVDMALRLRTTFLGSLRSSLHFTAPMYSAIAAMGFLLAASFPAMGLWSLVLLAMLLAVTRYAFLLYVRERQTYMHTLEALANAIEVQDVRTQGHASRVAELSAEVGRELGLHGKDLENLGYAALLHDIGKLAIDENSFDALMEQSSVGDGVPFHAERGAEMITQAPHLKGAIPLVMNHHKPYQPARRSSERENPTGARIINVVSAYDRLTQCATPDECLTPADAMRRIRKDKVTGYDPRVVRALMDVLKRRGVLKPAYSPALDTEVIE